MCQRRLGIAAFLRVAAEAEMGSHIVRRHRQDLPERGAGFVGTTEVPELRRCFE